MRPRPTLKGALPFFLSTYLCPVDAGLPLGWPFAVTLLGSFFSFEFPPPPFSHQFCQIRNRSFLFPITVTCFPLQRTSVPAESLFSFFLPHFVMLWDLSLFLLRCVDFFFPPTISSCALVPYPPQNEPSVCFLFPEVLHSNLFPPFSFLTSVRVCDLSNSLPVESLSLLLFF